LHVLQYDEAQELSQHVGAQTGAQTGAQYVG
jgi:hypothetical protein